MKYGFKEFSIASPFATTQCGHLAQDYLLDTYHDEIKARIFYLEDESKFMHISLDLLAFDYESKKEIEDYARGIYGDLDLVTSCTHTHYANNIRDEKYIEYLKKTIKDNIKDITIKEYGLLKISYQTVFFDEVGKSRISGYESGNEYLTLVRINSEAKTLINLIIYNCHPTILKATVPYFSSEFPGYVLKELKMKYNSEDFSYMSGAMGDISTRFTRMSQDYEAVIELGDKLVDKIVELKNEKISLEDLVLNYKEKVIPYNHTFEPIDESKIRGNLSDRELETIGFGKIMRKKLKDKKHNPNAHMGILHLGEFKIIFYPNEIFSEYLNYIDIKDSILVSYSNGYGPYILPIDFPYVTYEMFTDTLDIDTKNALIEALKEV